MTGALVTGGAGFIGGHLVRRLARSSPVTVLDLKPTPSAASNVRGVSGDVRDRGVVESCMRETRLVFHLAAQVSVQESITDPTTCMAVNVGGTENVLDAARRQDARHVVLASSSAVYGNGAPPPHKEGQRPEPASPYAQSKLDGERLCATYSEQYGLRTTCLRFFNVYGPGQPRSGPYAAVIPIFMEAAKVGTNLNLVGGGLQTRDFVFVEDVVEACLLAARRSGREPHAVANVGTGIPVTVRHLAETIVHLTESRSKLQDVPARPGEVMHSWADLAHARAVLGFKARWSLDEGLSRMLA